MHLELYNILGFLSDFGIGLIDTYSNVFNWFLTEFNIPGVGYISVFELMFGGGISIFLTATILKWLIGIIM